MGERVELTKTGKPVKHGGSGSGYSHHGCRCDECTEANTTRNLAMRKKRELWQLRADQHGKASTYSNWQCRCDPCIEAWNTEQRRQYAARTKKNSEKAL